MFRGGSDFPGKFGSHELTDSRYLLLDRFDFHLSVFHQLERTDLIMLHERRVPTSGACIFDFVTGVTFFLLSGSNLKPDPETVIAHAQCYYGDIDSEEGDYLRSIAEKQGDFARRGV